MQSFQNTPDAERLSAIFDRKASEIFIVLDARGTTCLYDPGLRRTYSTPIRKVAENVARSLNPPGVVVTLAEGMKRLINTSRAG